MQHVGSVDIFLEALADASPGDVLVVDNAGRLDEACVGDLIAHVVGATDYVAADDDGVLWQTDHPSPPAPVRRVPGTPAHRFGL